jgi:tetratricopeptide (TPR) repeat protein
MKLFNILLLVFLPVLLLPAQQLQRWTKIETEADTLLNRGQVYDALKRYTKVIRMQEKKKFTGQSDVRFKRALCYYYIADFNRALADLNIFIVQNPAYLQARLLRAYVYRELNNQEPQLEDLNAVLATGSYNVDLLKWRAGLLLEMSRAKEALDDLRILHQFHNDEEVELNLGLAWYYLGDLNQALAHFNEALFINGGYLPAYRYAALLLLQREEYQRALEYINLALLLAPDDLNLIFNKGLALAETGHTDAACSYLNKAFYGGIEEAAGYLEHYCYSGND